MKEIEKSHIEHLYKLLEVRGDREEEETGTMCRARRVSWVQLRGMVGVSTEGE